jgi:peptidoglycan/xylan/chitin deacetylase (PgdA/CDA1 family)
MYHSVSREPSLGRFAVPPQHFASQLSWLARAGWRVTSVRDALGEADTQDRTLVMTFDDGYADNYQEAFPQLQQYGFTATMFLPTDFVGRANGWEETDTPVPLLTWPQGREMAEAGFEIGSHSASHLDIRRAPLGDILDELARSKAKIEDQAGAEVVSFAYPYGYFRPEVPELLARTGYRCAVLAGTYGRNGRQASPFALHRVPVWGSDGLLAFRLKVRGWFHWQHYTSKVATEVRWLLGRRVRGSRDGR